MLTLPYYYCLLLAVSLAGIPLTNQQAPKGRVCGSIAIRYRPSSVSSSVSNPLECSVVDGDVYIVFVFKTSISPEEYLVFANLTEITGFLLVYDAEGLHSLGRLFPNLRTIGGVRTICNYSLMVANSPDLKDIGLTNLEQISRGGVRIEQNPKLCFVDSVNWRKLTVEQRASVFISENNASCRLETRCALNASAEVLVGCELLEDERRACWSSAECQKSCRIKPTSDCNCRIEPHSRTAFLRSSMASSSWLWFEWPDVFSDEFQGHYLVKWEPKRSNRKPKADDYCASPSESPLITTRFLDSINNIVLGLGRHPALRRSVVSPPEQRVTSSRVNITRLDSFTEYHIRIYACPSCRFGCQLYAAFDNQTMSIPYSDVVNVDTTTVERLVSDDNSRKITWKAPSKPNGRIHSYRLYMEEENEQQPSYRLTVRGEHLVAYILSNIPNGAWRLTIRTETDAGISLPSNPLRFNIP